MGTYAVPLRANVALKAHGRTATCKGERLPLVPTFCAKKAL
jgi:hypothetical protein